MLQIYSSVQFNTIFSNQNCTKLSFVVLFVAYVHKTETETFIIAQKKKQKKKNGQFYKALPQIEKYILSYA